MKWEIVHPATEPAELVERFVLTGEFRWPKVGEWFLGLDGLSPHKYGEAEKMMPIRAEVNCYFSRPILRKLEA